MHKFFALSAGCAALIAGLTSCSYESPFYQARMDSHRAEMHNRHARGQEVATIWERPSRFEGVYVPTPPRAERYVPPSRNVYSPYDTYVGVNRYGYRSGGPRTSSSDRYRQQPQPYYNGTRQYSGPAPRQSSSQGEPDNRVAENRPTRETTPPRRDRVEGELEPARTRTNEQEMLASTQNRTEKKPAPSSTPKTDSKPKTSGFDHLPFGIPVPGEGRLCDLAITQQQSS